MLEAFGTCFLAIMPLKLGVIIAHDSRNTSSVHCLRRFRDDSESKETDRGIVC